jgi:hypothetical protein
MVDKVLKLSVELILVVEAITPRLGKLAPVEVVVEVEVIKVTEILPEAPEGQQVELVVVEVELMSLLMVHGVEVELEVVMEVLDMEELLGDIMVPMEEPVLVVPVGLLILLVISEEVEVVEEVLMETLT